jgi:2-hydroxycyclohexanecarboxyl-CoA dehydrogenase
MSDMLDLNGKVALVTGAGQNVGREIALYLSAHNAGGVVVNDFVMERAEAVAAEIEAAGGKALALQGDVTDYAGVHAMVAKAKDHFGGVDILVNNAGNAGATPGLAARGPFWVTPPEAWSPFIGVNFYGPINCASAVIPIMIEREGGRIINIISDAGRMGEASLEIYSAAKAGAAGLTRALARSLGRYNITANNVAISAMNTPGVAARLKADPERFKKAMSNYVIRRMGEPSDIAAMVLFLASDASGWITGQTYPVNGGFSFAL